MARYLCISVTFLDPLFHGKGNNEEPEWPPSPMRLYQALLAGSRICSHNGEWSGTKAEAFRWLESRKPPLIITPEAHRASAYTLFVPNNDSDKAFDRQDRLTGKDVRPHRMPDGNNTLYYLWAVDPIEWHSAQSCAELLCSEARHLIAVGWGIDQVVGDGRILNEAQGAALPGQRWRAVDGEWPGYKRYRVPVNNSLTDLEKAYESFITRIDGNQYRPPLRLKKFGTVTYIRETALPPRPFAVFEFPDDASFRQENMVRVAAMLRSLTCKLALSDTHKFPGGSELFVAGHMKEEDRGQPRFSYIPLPTIGGPHADGLIRRVMMAEPHGGTGLHAHWAQNRLRNAVLIDQNGKERGILRDLWRSGSKDMITLYTGASKVWCSVTPVILPGYDDFRAIARHKAERPIKAERLLFKCLRHAGIPVESVEGVAMRKAPFWPGSQHPMQYHRPNYLRDRDTWPGWHVRVVFREPVPGPLAIGAGRHCGLGVLASTGAV